MGVAALFARVYEWTLLLRVKTDSHQKLKNLQVKSVQSALGHISIDLCSACHVYPISRGAWIISILFILNGFT